MRQLGTSHPLFILPTLDVPGHFLEALRAAGCCVLLAYDYLWMHFKLLKDPQGRHSPVLTKLRSLGLVGLSKVVL
eukprot:6802743-Alexandrium_andersonii.AAC.1